MAGRVIRNRPLAETFTVSAVRVSFVGEDFLNREFEESRDLKRQRQARIVFPGLERVDGLTRDADFLGEVILRPLPRGAEFAELISHR